MAYLGESTQALQAEALAAFLPDGKAWRAKNIKESNINKLLLGFGGELLRVHQSIDELACNYLISGSSQFLPEWEAMLGIPDSCFPGTGGIEERTQHVLVKLASLNVITEADWINLAKILGFDICIENGRKCSVYPLCYPLTYFATPQIARFTLFIFVKGIEPTVYPLEYPLQYASSFSNILVCILNKVKPADVQLIFKFVETLPC